MKAAVLATGSSLREVHGIGPAAAARILADAGDIARFPSAAISRPGTAPPRSMPPAASMRHRLSRAGNRRLNHVLYMAGIVQLRNDTAGRSSYRHLLADGKTPMEAMPCVRRRLADVAWRQLAGNAARKHAGSAFASPRRLPDVCMRSRCTELVMPYGGLGPFELLRP